MPRQKFLQIYSQLKQRIESGQYPVGQLLPSENTLIGEFDCSRNTVRRAISELVRMAMSRLGRAGACATSSSPLSIPPTPWV